MNSGNKAILGKTIEKQTADLGSTPMENYLCNCLILGTQVFTPEIEEGGQERTMWPKRQAYFICAQSPS